MSNKKTFDKIDEKECFREKGDTSDEIVLKFDDDEELYVSEIVLSLASPVFKAMFELEWKEKTTREIELKGKQREDFHEFLLCLHPGVQKSVDVSNFLRIVCLAEEYQVAPTVDKCKKAMEAALSSATENASRGCRLFESAGSCLNILMKAQQFEYTEIIQMAITCLARFDHMIITGQKPFTSFGKNDCKTLFDNLPEKVKVKLLLTRLGLCDNGQFR